MQRVEEPLQDAFQQLHNLSKIRQGAAASRSPGLEAGNRSRSDWPPGTQTCFRTRGVLHRAGVETMKLLPRTGWKKIVPVIAGSALVIWIVTAAVRVPAVDAASTSADGRPGW